MNSNSINSTVTGGVAAIATLLIFIPGISAAAVSPNAFLGGGNALARALAGESQGLVHASSTSGLLAHLTFASTRGGRPEETPPADVNENSDTGGNTSTDQSDGPAGQNGAPAEAAGGNPSTGSGQANGGASAGNGGNGGDGGGAAPGGLVRAGSVISNANALNMINVSIIRISTR
ncbi:hypothetical protein COU18_01095 [Candidatus Kaiserbacteria bacterium CG10_big_fil_rev_8_21_14_0_10_51_14]|uniref:Uncharacterized protein n=1 Tax=Candidatus Kaiserbacteria bacterium CG10_big_fil_rev_8_21_14_0_10_51_14 TaxID=1974610 RepID=A0A2H0UC78_9BACT|nr:MAG: hypothetical protein COU18_01095 [Candidatus Kaiserbacteria bacterium CG10_big_fil_rev_8_21_14_0_10_51_14]